MGSHPPQFTVTNLSWAAGALMSDMEAMFWRAEVDPRLRSSGVVLDVLTGPPDWDRLVEAHRWVVQAVPRLRQRVVEDLLHIGPPAWVPAEVDLSHHLTRLELTPDGEPGGRPSAGATDALLRVVADLHAEPFEPDRPLWKAVLVTGLADGRAAYLLKVHHSMTDGQGMVQLFDLVHGHGPDPVIDKPVPVVEDQEPTDPLALTLERAVHMTRRAPERLVRVAGIAGRSILRTALEPDRLRDGVAYATSLSRVGSPAAGHPSPLLRRRGTERRVVVADARLADLRAAGRAAGGSVNDAYVAAVLGGLRLYHARHGLEAGEVPMALPISLRRPGDDPGGNRFAAGSMAGPAGEEDPIHRMQMVRDRVAAARAEPALDFMSAVAPLAARLPNRVLARVARRLSESLDLQVSNIPGLRRPAYIAGVRIEKMYVFGPVPGCAVMATMLSHEGTCHIGVTLDSEAVPDASAFADDLRQGVAEVVATGAGRG